MVRLAKVLARIDADLCATETLKFQADQHASLSTLLAAYDVLAREAQIDRWTTLLYVAPFPEDVADDLFTSPYYECLEAALARHEAAGHDATSALTVLAPRVAPGEDRAALVAQLGTILDQATHKLRPANAVGRESPDSSRNPPRRSQTICKQLSPGARFSSSLLREN